MARTAIVVRTATQDDAEGLAELWTQLRGHGGRGAQYTPAPTVERVLEALVSADGDSTARMLVAVSGDAVVGMALAVLAPVSPFISFQVVQVDYLQVRQGFERQGVGKALLASATAYADEVGSDHLLVNVFPGARCSPVLCASGVPTRRDPADGARVGASAATGPGDGVVGPRGSLRQEAGRADRTSPADVRASAYLIRAVCP